MIYFIVDRFAEYNDDEYRIPIPEPFAGPSQPYQGAGPSQFPGNLNSGRTNPQGAASSSAKPVTVEN